MVLVFLWPPPLCSVEQPQGCSERCQLAGALGAAVPDGDSSAPVKAKRASRGRGEVHPLQPRQGSLGRSCPGTQLLLYWCSHGKDWTGASVGLFFFGVDS